MRPNLMDVVLCVTRSKLDSFTFLFLFIFLQFFNCATQYLKPDLNSILPVIHFNYFFGPKIAEKDLTDVLERLQIFQHI